MTTMPDFGGSPRAKVVAVLGMHRSGTSWLAGTLQEMGLDLGEVDTRNPFNAKGNRENRFLMDLHEGVLRSNGGSWRSPRYPNRWRWWQRRKLAKHVRKMNQMFGLWGFKDPRTLLLLDAWEAQVPELIRVGIYRDPSSVVASLIARQNDFTKDEALGLWRIYNERLLAEYERRRFPVIRFGVSDEELFEQAQRIAKYVGLPQPEQSDTFFDKELVHNSPAANIPIDLAPIWDRLEDARRASMG